MDRNKNNQRLIHMMKNACPGVRPLKRLLENGADINFQDETGFTALMYATVAQQDRTLDYLLRQGANPLIINHERYIASELIPDDATAKAILKDFELLFATMNNDLASVKLIIKAGAQLDFQGPSGYTPLMIAVEQQCEDLLIYLISQGANPYLSRDDGKNCFDLAPTLSILRYLKKTCNLSEYRFDDISSVFKGHLDHFSLFKDSTKTCN